MRYLPLIFKNSLRSPWRSVLTICSVAASLCLLGLLMSLYQAFFLSDATPESALRLVTRNKISLARPLPLYYREKIKAMPHVREVMTSNWFGGVYKEPKNFFARFAADPATLFTVYPEYKVPDDQKRAFQTERTACMIGQALANKYDIKLGDRVTLKGDIYPVTMELTVRAIYDYAPNNEVLYFNREYLSESIGSAGNRDFAGTFVVLVDSPAATTSVAQAVDDEFRNSTMQTKTETEKAFALSFVSFLGNVKMFLLSICAAVTFTMLLVSGNTMAMAVRERVREVGIMKTLGFTSTVILGVILGEAVVIALIGGAVGCGAAILFAAGVRMLPSVFPQVKTLSVGPPVVLLCLGVAAFIGLVSSMIPAWGASRTTILDALKSNG